MSLLNTESTGEEQPAASPSTSVYSISSELDQPDHVFGMPRSSPSATSQSSPLSICQGFQRPEFLGVPALDSETSSRSSHDGFLQSKETTAERLRKYRVRTSRKNSSESSTSEDEQSPKKEDDESAKRKLSKAVSEDFGAARAIDAPRGRIANIRRESNCSVDSEVAHERLVKVSQQVSTGFDDFCIDNERFSPISEMRRRAPSMSHVGEPITIVTNVFLPHSCSPSPTRLPDHIKQCYSPSTQQMVRPNIPYTPSPSTSPIPGQSPTRGRKLLSLSRSGSPSINRKNLKRKLTTLDMDSEAKRAFATRNNTSPLVTERTFPYPVQAVTDFQDFANPTSFPASPAMSDMTEKSATSSSLKEREDTPVLEEKNDEMETQSSEILETDESEIAEQESSMNHTDDELLLNEASKAAIPEVMDDSL